MFSAPAATPRATCDPTAKSAPAITPLRWLVERFTPEERYPEARVNELIAASHHDVETLRRELIGAGLMQRERGVYWRPASA